MDSLYYQFVNYIQSIPPIWFMTIFIAGISGTFLLIVKFFKRYDGSQTRFEKLSLLILAMMLFGAVAYITHLWC